jgi:hypothetical protein
MAAPEAARQSTWVDRYGQLLQASGLDRERVLSAALQHEAGDGPAVISLAQCLEQPALLTDQVKADYPQASESRTIRARVSVLQQDLALNIIAPLTLRLFRDGETTLPDPDCIGLTPVTQDRAGPAARWFQMASGTSVDEDRFIRSFGSLASDWYPVFRKALGVSPGAYWSSIGLGLGAPFSAVWNLAAPVSVCNLAQRWLREFNNDANQFIDWIPAVFNGQTTAIPQRKGCCLKYLLPEGGYCGTCGVYRKERLAALRQQKPGPAPGQWQPGQ